MHQRIDFATSMIDGRTVSEINAASRSAEEIGGLWRYLSTRLGKVERRGARLPFDGPDRRHPNHGRPFAGPVARPAFGRRAEHVAVAHQVAE